MFTIHTIIASHNRSPLTLRAVSSLVASATNRPYGLSVYLFDDGSTDGTAASIRTFLPAVRILRGTGSSFWAAGMAAAESAVLNDPATGDGDFILWLNDDVVLDEDSLDRLISVSVLGKHRIAVGAVRDPETGMVTYSGLRKAGLHPLRYSRVRPDEHCSLEVDTFNGNVVLVPAHLAKKLKGIDGGFAHAFADIDYGIRARQEGASVRLVPGTVGTCKANGQVPSKGVRSDWSRFTGIKGGGHLPSLTRILRRHHPFSWPIFVSITYALWWLRRLRFKSP